MPETCFPSKRDITSERVLHIIPSLERAGAELVMLGLLEGRQSSGIVHVVACFGAIDAGMHRQLEGAQVAVVRIEIESWRPWRALDSFVRLLREFRPTVVHGWMVHACILGAVLKLLMPRIRLVWGIHSQMFSRTLPTKALELVCIPVSWLLHPTIIYPSDSSRRFFTSKGYSSKRSWVIGNGIDLSRFRQCPDARKRFRQGLDIDNRKFVVGCLARWHPDKDHRTLFGAIERLLDRGNDLLLVCAGAGLDKGNAELMQELRERGLEKSVILLGPLNDVVAFLNGIDLHVTSSVSESFGNVVVEALACGTPVVVTDCGGPAEIVGQEGCIVPTRSPVELGNAIEDCRRSGVGAEFHSWRLRVIERFSLQGMIHRYEKLYLCGGL